MHMISWSQKITLLVSMNSAGKLIVTFLFICSVSLTAQTGLGSLVDFADSLYKAGNYFDAITEYKRLLFFDEEGEHKFHANYFIASSYKEGAIYSEAVRFFTLAEISSASIDEIYDCRIEIVKINILRRSTDRANKIIDQMISDHRFYDKKNELKYWKGWSMIFSNDWEEASNQFRDISPDHDLFTFCSKVNDSLYNESLARIISYILPGSGQFYAGEYLSGSLSLLWNALWGYLTFQAFIEDRVFDGFVIANFLWLRFYNGNVYNAEKFVREKNSIITGRALDFLQYEYKGMKP